MASGKIHSYHRNRTILTFNRRTSTGAPDRSAEGLPNGGTAAADLPRNTRHDSSTLSASFTHLESDHFNLVQSIEGVVLQMYW
jgi:hypothetical protein